MNPEDDITVLAQEEHDDYNVQETFTEYPFQLFVNSNKSENTPPQSLHVLQSAYDDLRRKYNDTKQKYEIMTRAVRDMETQRLTQLNRPYSLSNGFGAAYASGNEAAGSSGETENHDMTNAQVRAQLGYAESLKRQIMKMQYREKEMEKKYTDLYTKYKRLEDDNSTLQQRNRKLTVELQSKTADPQQISELNAMLKEKEKEIAELGKFNVNVMERCSILEERLKSAGPESLASPMSVKQEKQIIAMLEDQNEFLEELKERMKQQDMIIKKQNTLIKELSNKKRTLSAPSSFAREAEGSSVNVQSEHPHTSESTRNRYPSHQPATDISQPSELQGMAYPPVFSDNTRSEATNHGYTVQSHGGVMCTSDAENLHRNHLGAYRTGLTIDQSNDLTLARQNMYSKGEIYRQDQGAIPRYPVMNTDSHDAKGRLQQSSSPHGVNPGPYNMRVRIPSDTRSPAIQTHGDVAPSPLVKTGAAPPSQGTTAMNQIRFPPSSPRQRKESSEHLQPMRYPNEQRMQDLRLDDRTLLETNDVLFSPVNTRPASGHTTNNTDRLRMPLQNADYENVHIPLPTVPNLDYVNISEVRQNVQSPRNSTTQVCPVCNKNFGNMPIQEFQMHVFDCVDGNDSEENLNTLQNVNKDIGHKECPMCNAAFPVELPQEEFERHVQEHFGEDPNFEVLQPL